MISTSNKIRLIRPSLFLALALAGCFIIPAAHATTVAVGTCTNYIYFQSIQTAVNSVPSGSTIDICPGTYPEQVTIHKKVTLIGVSSTTAGVTSDAAIIACPSNGCVQNGTDITGSPVAAQIFVDQASGGGVTISHLTVDGSNNQIATCGLYVVGIYYQNTAGTITDSVVRNQILAPNYVGCQPGGLAINIESNTGSPAVTISNNSVRNYDKNGITANGLGNGTGGPKVTVKSNTVVGIGATTLTAQNGIQIGFGATGTVEDNNVTDTNYTPATYTATGILIYGSSGVTVSHNNLQSTQSGIYPASGGPDLSADSTIVTMNTIGNTTGWDAIDLCSSNNTASSNTIYGSSESGVHDDDECTEANGSASGTGNTISNNTINEACAGILTGSDATGVYSGNTFFNVGTTLESGDSCTPLANVKSKSAHKSLRPAPYAPLRK